MQEEQQVRKQAEQFGSNFSGHIYSTLQNLHVNCDRINMEDTNANMEIRETKILCKTRHVLKAIEFNIVVPDRGTITKTTEIYDHGNAVAVLLYNRAQGTIILTEQFRMPTYINGNKNGMLLEACAGLIDKGETPDQTIKREIKEELGYVIETVEKIYEAYTSPGCLTEMLTLYIAQYRKEDKQEKGGGKAEEGEYIKCVEMPFKEAVEKLNNGEIREIKAIILLQHALLKRLFA